MHGKNIKFEQKRTSNEMKGFHHTTNESHETNDVDVLEILIP